MARVGLLEDGGSLNSFGDSESSPQPYAPSTPRLSMEPVASPIAYQGTGATTGALPAITNPNLRPNPGGYTPPPNQLPGAGAPSGPYIIGGSTPTSTTSAANARPTGGSLSDPSYVQKLIAWAGTQPGVNPSVANDPNYWLNAAGRFNGDENYFVQRMFTPEGAPEGSGGTSANVFTDPATAPWEAALEKLAGQLGQPTTPADFGPLTDYLRSYFQQLQGPAYTPADQSLIQTQALDPLTAQRDAAKKNAITQLAARGIPPSSGVAQSMLQTIDQNYAKLSTQQQAQFATNAIGLQQQRQAQAGQVGTALNTLENNLNTQNEQRALQGVNMLFQIPQLADTRMQLANGIVQPLNPSALLGNQYQLGNLGLYAGQQDANYWGQIGQLIAQAIGAM